MSAIRPLIIAEAANPEWVSVPLEGWSHSRAIARRVPAHVVTQIRNKEAFERAGLTEGQDFTAINSEAVARAVWHATRLLRGGAGKGWTTGTALGALSYYYFEHLVWQQFGGALKAGAYSLVHRVTPLSPTNPSIIAKRCKRIGVPFVWGPINGGVPWPKGFDYARRREKEWLSYVRGLYRVLPYYASTRRNASAIIVGSRDTYQQVPDRYKEQCVYIPENGVDPERFAEPAGRPVAKPLRVAFVGRLVPYKGADMLLEAAAPLIRDGALTVDIVGDGPEMDRLKAMAEEENLGDGVRLDGWVAHADLQGRLNESDIMGFPSVREFGGVVVLEAMALGLVPVVVDYGGPSELVTAETGYKVPIGSREAIVAGVRDVFERLTADPSDVRAMGERARARVMEKFTWDAKAGQTVEVYRWVLGERDKPDFGMPLP